MTTSLRKPLLLLFYLFVLFTLAACGRPEAVQPQNASSLSELASRLEAQFEDEFGLTDLTPSEISLEELQSRLSELDIHFEDLAQGLDLLVTGAPLNPSQLAESLGAELQDFDRELSELETLIESARDNQTPLSSSELEELVENSDQLRALWDLMQDIFEEATGA